MGILVSKNSKIVVQGMTGKEGSRATKEMLDYHTNIVCGVTPGKGGNEVHGLPVFDSVKEALDFNNNINTSVLYVPPLMVYDAAAEAMEHGIKTIFIVTENVPVKDTAKLVELAKQNNAKIIGPSSVGAITVGEAKIGSISHNPEQFSQGNIGIISKSGGMSAETAALLTKQGIGQSTVVGVGGDIIIGTAFTDALEAFEKDEQTKAVVLFGEIGGTYEEQVAKMIKEQRFSKPVVAFISGKFAELIKKDTPLGHAGAIIQKGQGTADEKKRVLKEAGVLVANYHDEIPELVKKALQ